MISKYYKYALFLIFAGVMLLLLFALFPGSASSRSLKSGEDFVSFLVDDDMSKGNPDAPFIIVEFSDFQCPFCRAFWMRTLPQLQKDIDEGRVFFVYRDFPLEFHPQAKLAAQAVECAQEQGKGWELHDLIFEKQAEMGSGTVFFTEEELLSWSDSLGVDIRSCLKSGKYAEEVENDVKAAQQVGLSGTPSFVIYYRESGEYEIVSGAQPYFVFSQTMKKLESR